MVESRSTSRSRTVSTVSVFRKRELVSDGFSDMGCSSPCSMGFSYRRMVLRPTPGPLHKLGAFLPMDVSGFVAFLPLSGMSCICQALLHIETSMYFVLLSKMCHTWYSTSMISFFNIKFMWYIKNRHLIYAQLVCALLLTFWQLSLISLDYAGAITSRPGELEIQIVDIKSVT